MRRVVALALLLTGCGLFSRTKSQFFSLDRIPGTVATTRTTPIAINSVELPPGFDRRDIVVRQANQKLEIRETQQWSASLQPLVLHTLAFDLAARLPEGMVVLPGSAKPAGGVRLIDVVFEDLVAGPDNSVTLNARWVVGGVSHHEQIKIDTGSLDSTQIATGMSQALAALADRIVAGL